MAVWAVPTREPERKPSLIVTPTQTLEGTEVAAFHAGTWALSSEAEHPGEARQGAFPSPAGFSSSCQAEKGLGVTRAPEECKARNSAQLRPPSLTQLRKNHH